MSIDILPLTQRELEVYDLLMKGYKQIDIADKLIVEMSTIHSHIMNILVKKLCHSRYELMAKRIKELEDEIDLLKQST